MSKTSRSWGGWAQFLLGRRTSSGELCESGGWRGTLSNSLASLSSPFRRSLPEPRSRGALPPLVDILRSGQALEEVRDHPWSIAVGGITLGGVGKTEVVSTLAQIFSQRGARVAVLCHGYRGEALPSSPRRLLTLDDGRSSRPRLILDPVDSVEASALEQSARSLGDEACMLRLRLPVVVQVWVGGRWITRWRAAQEAGATLIISDGGLYTPQLPRDWSICVIDPLSRPYLLPLGALTRPLSSLPPHPQCSYWIHRSDSGSSRAFEGWIRPLSQHAPILSDYRADTLIDPHGALLSLDALKGRAIYTLTGIARPHRFYRTLSSIGVRRIGGVEVRDHGSFPHSALESALKSEAWCVTTEKDRVKLPVDFPVYTLRVKLSLDLEPLDLEPSERASN
jgi:tetraacyldisaccharide 4'-kinase